MLERISIYWRVLATGLSFATFGVGGLVLRVLVFPLLGLIIWERQQRIRIARAIIRNAFRAFIGLMQVLGILRVDVIGRERLERGGLLILANHPTLLDTVFLMSFVKRAGCIVRAGLWNNPFTSGPVRAAGYINNDQGVGMVADSIASLQGGSNLIIFPEGTRTPYCGTISLKRGAANIAVRSACNVTPVVINCVPMTLRKGEKWWHVPPRRMHYRIEVHDDIQIENFIGNGISDVLAARHLTDFLQNYFTEESQRHA